MTTASTDQQPLRFGIFDWIDQARPTTLADQFEQRLSMLEDADRAGFWCYHLAEHHGTPLSMAPSPHLFLAAAAQRTRRMRLGPLVTLLPIYHPIRVIEEICMLDHLSRGRVELGVGRGIVPAELAQFGVLADASRAMFLEALEVVVRGLREGQFSYEGRFYTFPNAIVTVRPLQRPYPPLWYPAGNPESLEFIAKNGINTMFGFTGPTLEQTAQQLDRYRQLLAAHQGDPDRLNGHVARPLCGLARHIFIADSDKAAAAAARPAFLEFRENFITRPPFEGPEPLAIEAMRRRSWDQFVDDGGIFVGEPETVRRGLQHYIDVTSVDYVVAVFAFGNLTAEQVRRSMGLFIEQVMPNLRPAPSAARVSAATTST